MSAVMKLKTLQSHLQDLRGFDKPKIEFEQYETPAHIAAISLYTIQTQFEDIESKLIFDAGCGAGMLSLGAALMGADFVTAMDIDDDALQIFKENVNDTNIINIDVLQSNFLNFSHYRLNSFFDTVLMNPPFGTKNNSGIDIKFLRRGLHLSCNSVYSFHKSSTRSHIEKKIKDWDVQGSVIAELKYNLPAMYKFHRQPSRDIAVDLWRVQHSCA